jgi:hypothetical protein
LLLLHCHGVLHSVAAHVAAQEAPPCCTVNLLHAVYLPARWMIMHDIMQMNAPHNDGTPSTSAARHGANHVGIMTA